MRRTVVHQPGRLVDQGPQHLALGLQLDQRELDALVASTSGLPKAMRSLAYATVSLMQYCAAPRLDAAWRMRFSLKKCCAHLQAAALARRRSRSSGTRTFVKRHLGVVGGHVEGPQHVLDLEARACRSGRGSGDAAARRPPCRWCARRSGRGVALWMPVFQRLLAVDDPARRRRARRWSPCAVASEPWFGSVMPNAKPRPCRSAMRSIQLCLLRSRAVVQHQQQAGMLPTMECSFCRSLCRPRPFAARCSRMMAMPRFVPPSAAELLGQREAKMAGRVGAAPHLAEQLLPLALGSPPRPSRCAHTRAGGRRSGCCRPAARAAGSRAR